MAKQSTENTIMRIGGVLLGAGAVVSYAMSKLRRPRQTTSHMGTLPSARDVPVARHVIDHGRAHVSETEINEQQSVAF